MNKYKSIFFYSLFLILFFSFSSLFADNQNFSTVSTYKISGYCIDTIKQVGSCYTPGYVRNILLQGNYAYLADETSGFRIIDITTTSNPVEVAYFQTQMSAVGIAISGNYAYLVERQYPNSALEVLDISNFSAISSVSYTTSSSISFNVVIKENYLYWTDGWEGLKIFDISTPAQPSEIYHYTSSASTYFYSIAINNNYAYLSKYDWDSDSVYLAIWDIGTPQSPIEKSLYNLSDYPDSIAINGNYAYVAGDTSLVIFDVSNPSNPLPVGNTAFSGTTYNMKLKNNYAYLTRFSGGLRIIDISNPANPNTLIQYYMPGNITYGLDLQGDYAFLGNSNGVLSILNIKLSPITNMIVALTGTTTASLSPDSTIGYYEFNNLPNGNYTVTPIKDHFQFNPPSLSYSGLSGNYYMQNFYSMGSSHLVTVLSNPTGMIVYISYSYYTTPFTVSVLSGSTIDISPNASFSVNSGIRLYLSSWSDVSPNQGNEFYTRSISPVSDTSFTFNMDTQYYLTTISNPTSLGFIYPSDGWYLQQTNLPCAAYPFPYNNLFDGWSGNVNGTTNPINLLMDGPKTITANFSVITTPPPYSINGYCYTIYSTFTQLANTNLESLALRLLIKNNTAFVCDYLYGLHIIDISTASSPHELSLLSGVTSYAVAVQGNYAYIAAYPNKLVIADISDYTNPQIITTLAFPTSIYNIGNYTLGIAVQGNYVYYAGRDSTGLKIIDISSTSNPVVVKTISSYLSNVAIQGNYAYLVGYYGLQIVDISDPPNASIVGEYSALYSYAFGLALQGNYAYIVDNHSGLKIFDISNPAQPQLVSFYNISRTSYNVSISGNILYLATYYYGVFVFDITNPLKPILINKVPGDFYNFYDATFYNGYLYTVGDSFRIYSPPIPIPDVSLALSGDTNMSTFSDSSGYYSFTNLTTGNYTVTPSKDKYIFAPVTKSFSNIQFDQYIQNFIGYGFHDYTFNTNPPGKLVKVNGINYPAPYTLNTVEFTYLPIGADSPQAIDSVNRLVFNSWSDGSAQNHSIQLSLSTTFTVSFDTQNYVSMNVSPPNSGTIQYPNTGWYYQNTTLNLYSFANSGYFFSNWTGDLGGLDNPTSFIVNNPKTITANFSSLKTLPWDNSMGDFSSSVGINNWGFELPVGAANVPEHYLSNLAYDHSGVLVINFINNPQGFKMTDYSRFTPNSSQPWYTLRLTYYCESPSDGIEIMPDLLTYPNSSSYQIQEVGASYQGKGQVIPNQWNTLDTYLYCHAGSGLLQLVVKNNMNLTRFFIDSIELLNSKPSVITSSTGIPVQGGHFDNSSSLAFWSTESTLDGVNGIPTLSWSSGIAGQSGALKINFNTQNQGVKLTSKDTYSAPTGTNTMLSFKVYSDSTSPSGIQVIGLLYNIAIESTQNWTVSGYGNFGNFPSNTWNLIKVPLTNGTSSTQRLQILVKNTSSSPANVYIDDIQLFTDPSTVNNSSGLVYLSLQGNKLDKSLFD